MLDMAGIPMEPESFTASLSIPQVAMDFEQEDASRLGEITSTLLEAVAGFIKITDLHGVTFAVDYEAGLALIKRVYDDDAPVSHLSLSASAGLDSEQVALPFQHTSACGRSRHG